MARLASCTAENVDNGKICGVKTAMRCIGCDAPVCDKHVKHRVALNYCEDCAIRDQVRGR